MESLANYLTRCLMKNSIVEQEREEEYVYGFQLLIGKAINYTTLLILALIHSALIPGIIFMIVFFSMRGRTGGYHAKTPIRCYLGTIICYLLISQVVAPIIQGKMYAYIIIIIFSGITILIFTPINHPNLMLDSREIAICRKSSKHLYILLTGGIWIANMLHINQVYITYAIIGLGLDAILINIAKITGQEVKENEKNGINSIRENCGKRGRDEKRK